MALAPGAKVCVTGASGFIASHIVKQLLEKGYTVHGTVRDASNAAKTAHLTGLPGASERLKLFSAGLLDQGAYKEAISGCCGVFHVASPLPPKQGACDQTCSGRHKKCSDDLQGVAGRPQGRRCDVLHGSHRSAARTRDEE
mmetsp:Transcript_8698/g.12684  ORF Transcript_8698/g.12684 Transcript_8698/m.12684 type:complete len:141 (+) Transcript_8698:141-563(+)